MPRIPQILLWALIYSKAKLSINSQLPQTLWHEPNLKDKVKLIHINWYDIYQAPSLTFKIKPVSNDTTKLPILVTIYYVNPLWQLTSPFEQEIERIWEINKKNSTPNLITTPKALLEKEQCDKLSVRWFLIKQNDPDIQRLIASRIIKNKPLIPPYTSFYLVPIGITQPIINPKNWSPKPFNIDPTSEAQTKDGHTFTQKLCHSNGFLTRPEITCILGKTR